MSERTRHIKCTKALAGLALSALALSGCNSSSGFLGNGTKAGALPPVVERPAAPDVESSQTVSAAPSDSRVGTFASGLRAELTNVQSKVAGQQADIQSLLTSNAENVEVFYGTFAAVEARLHLGTLPNNPVLIEQWNEAQASLDQIAWNVRDLDLLMEGLINQAASINEVRRQVQTLGGDPEGNARDRSALMGIERDATATLNLIDRLQQESLYSMSREASFVQIRRDELATLQEAIRVGDLADTTIVTAAVPARPADADTEIAAPAQPDPPAPEAAEPPQQAAVQPAPTEPEPAPAAEQQVAAVDLNAIKALPLVIIRFDRPSVVYEGPLERAIQKTLAEDPQTQFNLVAVFPPREDEAELMQAESASWNFAQSVFRSLTEKIGVAPEQIEMRTQVKASAKSNEVHIYVSPKAL